MTDQHNETANEQQQGTEAPTTSRPRRSRRATRPVMTPEEHAAAEQAAQAPEAGGQTAAPTGGPTAGEPGAGPGTQTAGDGAQPAALPPADEEAAAAERAPRKPARRRRTKADAVAEPEGSAAPEGAAAPETAGGADGSAAPDATTDAGADAAEPAPKAKRTRRTKKAAQEAAPQAGDETPAAGQPAEATAAGERTPAAEQEVGETPAPATPAAEEPAAGEPATADRPAQRRRSRRAGAAAGAPEPRADLDVFAAFGVDRSTIEDETTEPAQVDIDVPERDASTAITPEDPAEDPDEDDEDDAPRLPATALLFQAPDASAGRRSRRRAGAPAGPPAPAADDAEDTTDAKDAKQRAGAPARDDESSEQGEGTEDSEAQDDQGGPRRRRRRGGRGRRRSGGDRQGDQGEDGPGAETDQADGEDTEQTPAASADDDGDGEGNDEGGSSSRRRRRRRSRGNGSSGQDDGARAARDEVTALKGSTRLEAKRQRRREGRDSQRRRAIITEAEFLARRESVERAMVVREKDGRTQVAILEDGVLVEHYVARKTQTSMVGNVYLGRVQNVLPSMEAAFIDLGKGRNAVLYAGEVNWDAAGLEGQPRRIEQALSSGDTVLVQVTKDPIGHKGARLTAQITLAGRYLVLVPSGAMTGISRKLPDTERARLKRLLKEIVPDGQGVIVRTAAEGASEEELRRDVERLTKQWADIEAKTARKSTSVPTLLKGEPELATRVVRDVFNEDFSSLVVAGDDAWTTISEYVSAVAPDLSERVRHWTENRDVFAEYRIDEQLAKGMDRKVWLPSGGSLVIDRTEAMTVVDVNTGKFTGSGGTLEETVTRNNLEAAEEIVRQLRLRDIGGIIVIDFIDMVLEANRDLVMRRLVECLGRDRTRHQVAEVTSLGLVQMTRKRVGQGLVEAFSETCEHCHGRGFIVHADPVESTASRGDDSGDEGGRSSRRRGGRRGSQAAEARPAAPEPEVDEAQRAAVRATLATIAAAAAHAHEPEHAEHEAPAAPAADAKEFEQHVLSALPALPTTHETAGERLDRVAQHAADPAEAEEIEAAAADAGSVDGALLGNGQDEPGPVRLVEGGYGDLTPPSDEG